MRGRTKTVNHFPGVGVMAAGRFLFLFPLFRFRGISFSFAFLFPARFISSDDLKSFI